MSAGRIGSPSSMNTPPGAGAIPGARVDGDAKVRDTSGIPGLGTPGVGLGNTPPQGDGDSDAASVHISDHAKHRAEGHRRALDIARATPDIREDRVSALKKQIDEGSYQPDAGRIADGMLHEAIRDHLAENDR